MQLLTPKLSSVPTMTPMRGDCTQMVTRLSIARSDFESNASVNLIAETDCGKAVLHAFMRAAKPDLTKIGVPKRTIESLLSENNVYLVRSQVTNGLSVPVKTGVYQAICQSPRGARAQCLAHSIGLPDVMGGAQVDVVEPGATTEVVSLLIVSTKTTRGTISRIDMTIQPVGLVELTVTD